MSTPSSHEAPFLQGVVTQTRECIVTVDDSDEIVFANPAVAETLGYDPEELVGDPIDTLFPETHTDPPETVARIASQSATGSIDRAERLTLVTAGGEPLEANVSAAPADYDGSEYITLTIQRTALADDRDETDTDVERLLKEFLAGSPTPVLVLDRGGERIVDCNEPAVAFAGFDSRETLLARHASDLFVEGDADLDAALTPHGGTEQLTGLQLATADDGRRPVDVAVSPVRFDGRRRYVLHVTESESEAVRDTLRDRTAAIDTSMDGIAILNDDGEYTFVNEAHAEIYGYEDPDELVGETWHQLYGDTEEDRFENTILPEMRETGRWHGEAIGRRADGETFPQEVTLRRLDGGGFVCVVRDIGERKATGDLGVHRLERLNRASRELLQARETETIADICLDTLTDLFDWEVGCVRRLDDETNQLEVVATTETAAELLRKQPACNLESTFAGQALRQQAVIDRSADASEPLAGSPLAASLHVPLGGYGTLTAGSTEAASFSDVDVEGIKMLAGTVEAALARAQRESQLWERTEDLRQRRDQLETLNQINQLVYDLVGDLFRARSREAIEQQVCERLADSALYQTAWIGKLSVTGDGLSTTAAAGTNDWNVDTEAGVPLGIVDSDVVDEAIETGEVASQRRYQVRDELAASPDAVEAMAAVPIQHEDRVYGVLVVDAVREEAFETIGATSLEVLGKVIGFALSAVQNRELLLSNDSVQLEFEVTDRSCLAVAVSAELDCYCRIQRTVRSNDDAYLSYIELSDVDPERARDMVGALEIVSDCRLASEHADECVLEVKRDSCGVEVMMEYGATMRRAEAEHGVGTLVIEAPQTSDVREIADAYEQYNAESELVAKREVERPVKTAAEFSEAIEAELTDKQRSALASAYFSGYYEWPRESTGEELAEAIGISSATLHQHLRRAHRSIIGAVLDDEGREGLSDEGAFRNSA